MMYRYNTETNLLRLRLFFGVGNFKVRVLGELRFKVVNPKVSLSSDVMTSQLCETEPSDTRTKRANNNDAFTRLSQ